MFLLYSTHKLQNIHNMPTAYQMNTGITVNSLQFCAKFRNSHRHRHHSSAKHLLGLFPAVEAYAIYNVFNIFEPKLT